MQVFSLYIKNIWRDGSGKHGGVQNLLPSLYSVFIDGN